MAAYCAELRYPEDVLAEAVTQYCRRETFFPSCAELIQECDKLMVWRLAARNAVSQLLSLPVVDGEVAEVARVRLAEMAL